MSSKWIIKNGIAVPEPDLLVWGRWMETEREKYRKVDTIVGVMVSTVFLGLDHRFYARATAKLPPILWETMTFSEDSVGYEDQWRHSYQQQAYEFHEKKVRELQALLNCWPLHPLQ